MQSAGVPSMEHAIDALDEPTVRQLLAQVAARDLTIAEQIISNYNRIAEAERGRVVTFDSEKRNVDFLLNEKYAKI